MNIDPNLIKIIIEEPHTSAEFVIRGRYVEVRGKVLGTSEVLLKSYTDFKDNFGTSSYNSDLKAYNKMLELSTKNRFKKLFNNSNT